MQKTYEPGRYLFREHELGDNAFTIEKGTVEIVKSIEGEITVIATIGAGAIIGEMALISDKPRTASARAMGMVSASVVSRSEYERMLVKTDPLIKGVLRILAESVRDLTKS